jgi:glycosyltransferase involved in cell wall biosynthesis
MISILTLTYQRHHILEEAIQSFILQNHAEDCEMVIINDSPDVNYYCNHPRIKIANVKERFSSISAKIEWGYKQCSNDFIYRLDDDDLLAPDAIALTKKDIIENSGFDIYRSKYHYFFSHNEYQGNSDSINTGNVYSKKYLDGIVFPTTSFGEDNFITFFHNAKIYNAERSPFTMIYRWGMGTYHISGMGENPSDIILKRTDDSIEVKEVGNIILSPHFKTDYYNQLPKY